MSNKKLHTDSSTMHNSPNLEVTKMLFSKWGDKHSVENGKTFSAKNEWVIKPWKDMKEP